MKFIHDISVNPFTPDSDKSKTAKYSKITSIAQQLSNEWSHLMVLSKVRNFFVTQYFTLGIKELKCDKRILLNEIY